MKNLIAGLALLAVPLAHSAYDERSIELVELIDDETISITVDQAALEIGDCDYRASGNFMTSVKEGMALQCTNRIVIIGLSENLEPIVLEEYPIESNYNADDTSANGRAIILYSIDRTLPHLIIDRASRRVFRASADPFPASPIPADNGIALAKFGEQGVGAINYEGQSVNFPDLVSLLRDAGFVPASDGAIFPIRVNMDIGEAMLVIDSQLLYLENIGSDDFRYSILEEIQSGYTYRPVVAAGDGGIRTHFLFGQGNFIFNNGQKTAYSGILSSFTPAGYNLDGTFYLHDGTPLSEPYSDSFYVLDGDDSRVCFVLGGRGEIRFDCSKALLSLWSNGIVTSYIGPGSEEFLNGNENEVTEDPDVTTDPTDTIEPTTEPTENTEGSSSGSGGGGSFDLLFFLAALKFKKATL